MRTSLDIKYKQAKAGGFKGTKIEFFKLLLTLNKQQTFFDACSGTGYTFFKYI